MVYHSEPKKYLNTSKHLPIPENTPRDIVGDLILLGVFVGALAAFSVAMHYFYTPPLKTSPKINHVPVKELDSIREE
jgi:hypothetical protein